MKGYIIYDAYTGAVKHHGIQPQLPLSLTGEKVIEVDPAIISSLSSRKEYFVADGDVRFPAEFRGEATAHVGQLSILELPARMPPDPPSIESSLEAAIRENTAEVRALSARLEKMFRL
jgi:hypothetical protein